MARSRELSTWTELWAWAIWKWKLCAGAAAAKAARAEATRKARWCMGRWGRGGDREGSSGAEHPSVTRLRGAARRPGGSVQLGPTLPPARSFAARAEKS